MSTHNRNEIFLHAVLRAEVRCWLADVFADPDALDEPAKAAVDRLVDKAAEEIEVAVGNMRVGLNEVLDEHDKRVEPEPEAQKPCDHDFTSHHTNRCRKCGEKP